MNPPESKRALRAWRRAGSLGIVILLGSFWVNVIIHDVKSAGQLSGGDR